MTAQPAGFLTATRADGAVAEAPHSVRGTSTAPGGCRPGRSRVLYQRDLTSVAGPPTAAVAAAAAVLTRTGALVAPCPRAPLTTAAGRADIVEPWLTRSTP